MLVAQFLRARAWWRLDRAGANPAHVARSVVCLLEAAAYLQTVPDDDPDIAALTAVGCFRGGTFAPGPEGAMLVRKWQLADERSAGPADLLTQLAQAAAAPQPTQVPQPTHVPQPPASARAPRQPGPRREPVSPTRRDQRPAETAG
jgi:hypothetical protein